MIKTIVKTLTILIIILAVAFAFFRVADTDAIAMIEKYGQHAQKIEDGAGGWIYYRDQGKRDAPALLLLHGSNSSMQTWNSLITNLGKHFRIISYDQHGHGITGPHRTSDYSANAKIDTALKVLDAAAVEKAVWVGNSMGGWLTWRAALAHPERFTGMVLMDASGVQNGEEVKLYLGAKLAKSRLGQVLARYIMPRALVESSIEQNYGDPSKITDKLVDQYWELLRFPGNRQAVADRVNASREPEYWQNIGQISVPTLILWGEKDTVTPLSYAAAFNAKLPNSKMISYPNVGHLPMEEVPNQVALDIRAWLNR